MKKYGHQFTSAGGFPLALGAVNEGMFMVPGEAAGAVAAESPGFFDSLASGLTDIVGGATNVLQKAAVPAAQAYGIYQQVEQLKEGKSPQVVFQQPRTTVAPPQSKPNYALWGLLGLGVIGVGYAITR